MNVFAGDTSGSPTSGGGVVSTTAIQVKPMPTHEANQELRLTVKQTPPRAAGHYYWQKWPGRNRPFGCFGTVTLLARNTGILGCNVLLIVGNAGLFIWGVSWHVHPVCTAFAILITLGTLALLAKATLTEAGIIPRRRLEEYPPMQGSRDAYTNGPLIPAPTGMMDGVSVPLKWCRTCNIYRPLRASHCRECDCCVEEFDHHCPWVCNCIGKRNYRFFVGFLFMVVLLDVYVLFFSCFLLGWASANTFSGSFASAVSQYPIALVEALVAFVFLWCLGSLFGYHFFLILNNMTTNEYIKQTRAERAANVTLPPSQQWQAEEVQRTRDKQIQSHQHTVSCTDTCYELLCAPTPASLFDLEAWIPESGLAQQNAESTTLRTALSSASSGFAAMNGSVRQSPSMASHTIFSNAALPASDPQIDAAQAQHQREFEMDLARSRAEYEQRRAIHSQQQIQQQQLHRLMEAEMQARRGGAPLSLPYRTNVYPDPLPSFNPYDGGFTSTQIDSDLAQQTRARSAMVDREREFILNDLQHPVPAQSVRVHIGQ